MTPAQNAQSLRNAAHKQRLRDAGLKPATVWLSTEAHTKLTMLAYEEATTHAALIERLIMNLNGRDE